MSPSPVVTTRSVYPGPAPVVVCWTVFAANSRSAALVVVSDPLSLVAVAPEAPAAASNGLTVSIPLYSATRISGKFVAPLNKTVTVFEPAAAETMFFA